MKKTEIETIYNRLKELEYLEYGRIIPATILEQLFDVPVNEGWNYLGPYLAIKTYLEERGYLSTSENLEQGCLRILSASEMAQRADTVVLTLNRRIKRLQSCMINARHDEFSQKEAQEHLHATMKISASVRALSSSLADF